jgi:hypothetical protein
MSVGRIVPFGLTGWHRRVHGVRARQRIRNARHVRFRGLFDHAVGVCKTNTSGSSRIHGGERAC